MTRSSISGEVCTSGACDSGGTSTYWEVAGFSGKIDTNGYIYDLGIVKKLRAFTYS